MELEWMKELLWSISAICALIEPAYLALNVRRQCGLLGVNRFTYHYVPLTVK